MSEPPNAVHVVRSGEGQAIWYGRALMEVKADAADTGGVFSLLEMTSVPGRGPGGPPHLHKTAEKSFYILDGSIVLDIVGGESIPLSKGDFITIPRGVPHGFTITADSGVHLLQFHTPAGQEEFHREAGTPAAERRPPPTVAIDFTRIGEIAERHDMVMLTPPRPTSASSPPADERPDNNHPNDGPA